MADETSAVVKIREFVGLATNANPHRLPPGATVKQVNCHSPRVGEMAGREGMREVTFD